MSNPISATAIPVEKSRRTWSLLIDYRFVLIGLMFLLPFLVRAWRLSTVPEVPVPFDVDKLINIPAGQNAFDHYKESHRLKEIAIANAKVLRIVNPADLDLLIEKGWDPSREDFKLWLENIRPAMDEWRRGAQLTECYDESVPKMHFATDLNVAQSLRFFARVAICEGARAESEGDLVAAAKWYTDILQCSRHTSRGFPEIHRFISSALFAIGSERLIRWAELKDVTADQLRTVVADVQRIDAMTVPLSETLKAEYLIAINTLKRPDWWKVQDVPFACGNSFFNSIILASPEANPLPEAMKSVYWVVGEPLLTERSLRQVLVNQLAEIDKPLCDRMRVAKGTAELLFLTDPEIPSKPNEIEAAQIDRAIRGSSLTRPFLPRTTNLDFTVRLETTRRALLRIALAAQLFHREKGEYPQEAISLVPLYLEKWPDDPFDATRTGIRYRRNSPMSAVVWSVGSNGNDDEGNVGNELFEPHAPDNRSPDFGGVLKTRSPDNIEN